VKALFDVVNEVPRLLHDVSQGVRDLRQRQFDIAQAIKGPSGL
jgi:archaellum component FlaC